MVASGARDGRWEPRNKQKTGIHAVTGGWVAKAPGFIHDMANLAPPA